MIEEYLTVSDDCGPFEIKDKGSRFIAFVYPVNSSLDADTAVLKLRKHYHDSTHVCHAFRLGEGDEKIFRYSDDGEPSGTAGLPIYQELKRKELFNVFAAVVRYFGGVKLGTGGLTRAYSAAVKEALENVKVKKIILREDIVLPVPFDLLGIAMHSINTVNDAKIISQDYTETGILIKVAVPVARVPLFLETLTEKSAGKIRV